MRQTMKITMKIKKYGKISKKAQMEIMGLAIIIILIALAMLFIVSVVSKPSEDIKKTFTNKQLASNTVNTLLSTTTGCRDGLSVSQLLQDCAEGGIICCLYSNNNQCIENSCVHAEKVIDEILTNTLNVWNKQFELKLPRINRKFGTSCPGEKITSSPCCILPTDLGPMKITLDICG